MCHGWRSSRRARWIATTARTAIGHGAQPQLVAVSAVSNRSKADKGPDAWKPPLRSFWCTYSRAWVEVKSHYQLNITATEKLALSEMLDTCDQ
ncbi:hypothetical protein [Kitasatospora sp. NPDC048407]|uniref:hypothetical protein n=1 Tax=Kitasatospora sp. NPDC048407 TaxID=3364051 RepID=UPI00371150D6